MFVFDKINLIHLLRKRKKYVLITGLDKGLI